MALIVSVAAVIDLGLCTFIFQSNHISRNKYLSNYIWHLKVSFISQISVPGPPSNIKALPVDRNSIMISWMPPDKPNGEILGYSLYMKTMELGRQFTQDFPLASHVNYYTMGGLNQVHTFMHYTYLRMCRIIVRWIENTFIHG